MATLLLIDDCAAQRAEVRRALEAARLFDRILEAGNGVDGLKLLLAEPVDLVLSDVEMPGLDGEKLLQIKESRADVRDLPFLFLTASAELDRRVRLIEMGASDTLSKPFHPSELVARLRLHLKLKRLQDELKVKNEALSRLSTTDSLTGLRNRRYADEVLAIEVLRARRYRSPLSVVIADIDLFKRVNDEHGHAAGDTVLRRVAETLRDNLRATDVAARYGGEEFLVIMAHSDLSGAVRMAERWRGAVEHAPIPLSDEKAVPITISVGVTTFVASIATAPELVAEADVALYAAKQAGRNRVEVRSKPQG